MIKSVAIVLAAGSGKRMKTEVAKQFLLIKDKPLLYYSLYAFEKSPVDEVVVVTRKEDIEAVRELVDRFGLKKVSSIVSGGLERYDSVMEGLKQINDADVILIHDGARPFVSQEIIERNLEALKNDKAVVTAVKSKDTVKISDARDYVVDTPNRNYVWNIQTPQSFHAGLIKEAYGKLARDRENIISAGVNITDDAMVVETFMKEPIRLIQGDYGNIKITTPEDIKAAEGFLGE